MLHKQQKRAFSVETSDDSTSSQFTLAHWLRYRQDGIGVGNTIVPSMELRLFTTIQQMVTLHLPAKTTNPNPNPNHNPNDPGHPP